MAALSSILWVIGFILSVVIAPQLREWTWGPTMLCFGAATLFALPAFLRRTAGWESLYVLIPGIAISSWIVLRSYYSPIEEFATQDMLLVCMAVSTYIVFRSAGGCKASGNLLVGGIALILGASLLVIARQMTDRSFSPVFPTGEMKAIRGFFGHYSYCASFLIPCALLLAGMALHGGFHFVIRVCLLVLAIGGLAAVVLTNSRGGVVGGGCGLVALVFGSLLIGKREGKRWFVPVAILAPLLLVGCAILFLGVLEGVQQNRDKGGDLSGMLDNTIRLYLLGTVVSCISLHPWLGGGSRSFSWECFQVWDVAAYGRGWAKPEHVHNEFLQTVSEYGFIGGFLLVLFLGCVVVAFLAKTLGNDRPEDDRLGDGWRIGGFAGFVGLFVHSQFEGIFRIPPGAILLALCLAATSAVIPKPMERRRFSPAGWLLALCSLATMVPLFAYGWKGSAAAYALWPAFFSKEPLQAEEKIQALTRGMAAWPTSPLYHMRGTLHREIAAMENATYVSRLEHLYLALDDFKNASERHPFDPTNLLNQAGTLWLLEMNEEAEPLYRQAIKAQGNMESAFNANHRFADFLLRKAAAELAGNDVASAITSLEIAARHMDRALALSLDWSMALEGYFLNVRIHSSLGQAYEAAGDPHRAIKQYDYIAGLNKGESGNYLAAIMLSKQALIAWTERGSEEDALRLFIEADQRIKKARLLPAGVTPETLNEHVEFIRGNIRYLQESNVKASDTLNF